MTIAAITTTATTGAPMSNARLPRQDDPVPWLVPAPRPSGGSTASAKRSAPTGGPAGCSGGTGPVPATGAPHFPQKRTVAALGPREAPHAPQKVRAVASLTKTSSRGRRGTSCGHLLDGNLLEFSLRDLQGLSPRPIPGLWWAS